MCSYDTQLTNLYELSRRHSGLRTKTEDQTLLQTGFVTEGLGGVVSVLGGDMQLSDATRPALQSKPNTTILTSPLS